MLHALCLDVVWCSFGLKVAELMSFWFARVPESLVLADFPAVGPRRTKSEPEGLPKHVDQTGRSRGYDWGGFLREETRKKWQLGLRVDG